MGWSQQNENEYTIYTEFFVSCHDNVCIVAIKFIRHVNIIYVISSKS